MHGEHRPDRPHRQRGHPREHRGAAQDRRRDDDRDRRAVGRRLAQPDRHDPRVSGDRPHLRHSLYLTARQRCCWPQLRRHSWRRSQAESAAKQAEREQELETSQTALDVHSAYWELWYADRAVGVQERSLEVATKQVANAKLKAGSSSTSSRVDVLQFASSLASIKDSLTAEDSAGDARHRARPALGVPRRRGRAPGDHPGRPPR
ncbi:MAG: TolC family protein [Polyangiaceae bacterium]|nr:TolC family protein [Polyangiaceae bacterium]